MSKLQNFEKEEKQLILYISSFAKEHYFKDIEDMMDFFSYIETGDRLYKIEQCIKQNENFLKENMLKIH